MSLLDSVMGELTEQGIDIRLVVHPIFTVERDALGTLVGFRGESWSLPPLACLESASR